MTSSWAGTRALVRARARVLGRALVGAMTAVPPLAASGAAVLVLLRGPIGQNADGLLETIMSLQRVTLFYWGQDRFANLVPLLAAGIGDPVANADLQLAIRVAAGLLAPALVCAFASADGGPRAFANATALSALLFAACAPARMVHEALVEANPYGVSFALVAGAVLVFRRAGARDGVAAATLLRALGTVLVVAAVLENVSLVLIAFPLVLALFLLSGSRIALEFGLASLCGIAVTLVAMGITVVEAPTGGGFGSSAAALVAYWHDLRGRPGRFILAMLVLAVAGVAVHRRGDDRRSLLATDIAVVAAMAAGFVATGLSDWVVLNNADIRYLVPEYLLAAGLGGAAAERLLRTLPVGRAWRVVPPAVLTVALFAVDLARPWPPADEQGEIVGLHWRDQSRKVADIVLRRHLDAITGSYWDVWPAVFAAETRRYLAAGPREATVFGLVLRGDAVRDAVVARLLDAGRLRVGCIATPAFDCVGTIRAALGPDAPVIVTDPSATALGDGRRLLTLTVLAPSGDPPG